MFLLKHSSSTIDVTQPKSKTVALEIGSPQNAPIYYV